MNEKAMKVAMIVDRSGSMGTIASATVEGLNTFLYEQKQSPIEVSLQIVQFDNVYEEVYRGPVGGAPRFTLSENPKPGEFRFEPRNGTALRDAIGKTIVEVGMELEKMAEAERPSKVVIVIMTDGMENASREFTAKRIAEMIKHQQEIYNWQFQYLGANQDAVAVGASMNIPAANSMSFAASNAGTRSVMASASRNTRSYGVTGQSVNMAYTSDDRSMAMMPDEEDDAGLASAKGNLANSVPLKRRGIVKGPKRAK